MFVIMFVINMWIGKNEQVGKDMRSFGLHGFVKKKISAFQLLVKNIWEHFFHRRRNLTPSLKVFDSALERRCSQLHMRVFVWFQVL